MKFHTTVALLACLSPIARAQSCQADKCFPSLKLNPALAKIATTVCQGLLHTTPPATAYKTTTTTVVSTSTPAAPTNTVTTTTSTTVTTGVLCSTTITQQQALTTSYGFTQQHVIKRRDVGKRHEEKRQAAAFAVMAAGCTEKSAALTAKVSKACSCFLTPTATQTVTVTTTSVSIAGVPAAVTTTITATNTATIQSCTSTTTSTVYIGGAGGMTCGVPVASYTSGSITCANTAAAPSATNARFRIESNDSEGTLFEGCIASGPRSITTPSGGTHLCDGTNNNANPSPGATLSTQIDEAAFEYGFTYDGSYSSQFQDFFITRIGASTQTSSQFWGVLVDEVFTPRGGCQSQYNNGQRGLWTYDAFNAHGFLVVSPDYAAVAPNIPVTVSISVANPNSGSRSPQSGVSLSDKGISDASGQVTFIAPSARGCYVLKATSPGYIRSNAFYLSVF
ncbi:hypothetical protein E8E13_003496 [Curvularia kusanoi]|uniref:Uncharacterized protein n=1 Tax=Curvularia kusanoi TaxID=90978 RepID=A0A9P4T4R3_CURKU|nr:hypothetical protein E8E13_003496 [Curvularia kusanoi]